WDAQRRAGISDEQITQAMVEKLAVNKQREWPEPKDGEPRLHIKEQPAPVVPESISVRQAISALESADCVTTIGQAYKMGWNACRAAMLQGVEQPQNARQNIPENIPDGNSPAIPDDWVMVPKEPTQAMIKAWLSEVANFRGHAAGYKAALAAAPQREVK
ncbi:TPA: dATP/dGTP pyrophosphohydrolase domain-containing protein, partial [Salmonella enterica]